MDRNSGRVRPYEATGPSGPCPKRSAEGWQARYRERAKIDAVDARKLAQMAASLDPRRTPAPSKTQRRLQELQTARDALIRQRTALLNRRRQLREPFLKQQNQTQINMFERHLRAIDRKLQTLIAADEARARKLEILTSIPGIADTTAAGLLAEMPELGTLSGKAAASPGLAAVPRESGTWQGRAFIRGGRARARRLLYMAVAALRWNPDLAEPEAERARQARQGGPRPVMRKLIVLANTLVRQDRTWLPVAPRAT